MIYSGINNYCATSEIKKQMGSLEADEVDCSNKTIFTSEEISKMVNLGNAKVESVTYSNGRVTNLVVESNSHIFTLCGDGTFVMDDEECGGLVQLSISDTVLTQFPELATTGNGCTTPGDNNYSYMGGCYTKGNPNNNYIWYSGFLWRIMGINADGTVRMIVDENVTVLPWGGIC